MPTPRRPKGTVDPLGNNRWRLAFELPRDDATGKRRRPTKTVTAANRKAALEELATFITQRSSLEQTLPRRTVNELIDVWLEHLQVAGNTKTEWADALRRYVRPHIGTMVVADVDVELLERLWQQLQRNGGRNRRKLDPATVRKARQALRLAFAQAVRWRWIDHNPVADSKITTSSRRRKVNAPQPDDVTVVTTAIQKIDPDFTTWLRLTAHVGERRGEGLGLRWTAIDLEAGTVAIRTVVILVGGRTTIVEHPKNESSIRTVSIARSHVAALKAMRARQMEKALAAGIPWTDHRFLIAADPEGQRPYAPSSVARRLRKLQIRHKLPRVTIRQLRHHMATQAISRGHDVRTVAGRGGWENPDVLLRVYADWVPARDRALADDLDADVV